MLETLNKQQFDSVKELAEASLKISETKNILLELENTKDEYIEKREKETTEKIQKLFDNSKDLIAKISKNNEKVHIFYTTISSYKEFLDEGLIDFKQMLTEFNERSELWDKKVESQYKEFGELENKIKKDKDEIEQKQTEIKKSEEEIRRAKIKINDEREQIKRIVERIKNKQI